MKLTKNNYHKDLPKPRLKIKFDSWSKVTEEDKADYASRGFGEGFHKRQDEGFAEIEKLKQKIIDSIYDSGKKGERIKDEVFVLLHTLENTHY